MIKKDEKLISYLNASINNVYKILPLYEEQNIGLEKYIDSLFLELVSLQEFIDLKGYSDYIALLATIKALKTLVILREDQKTIKREVFKGISCTKNLIEKLEGE